MKVTVEKVVISLALLLVLYVILFYAFFDVFVPMDEPVINYIAECLIWFPIGLLLLCMEIIRFTVTVLPLLILEHSCWSFLFIMLLCFTVSFLLNWKLPEQSRPLARCWPIVCFMMGMAYKDFLYVHLRADDYIWWGSYLVDALVICLFPALLGLLAGTVVKWWGAAHEPVNVYRK